MGQQQLLLIILGVIIVGIAIAVGLSLFTANSIQANKDAIINDLNNLAANAYQYRIRPVSMAGGGGSYLGYTIPTKMASNENATFSYQASADQVIFTGLSVIPENGSVQAQVNEEGRLEQWQYTGYFLNQ